MLRLVLSSLAVEQKSALGQFACSCLVYTTQTLTMSASATARVKLRMSSTSESVRPYRA